MKEVIIGQVFLPGASAYERKSQAIDAAVLSAEHEVRLGDIAGADIVHVYASRILDPAAVRDLTVPFISNARTEAVGFTWRKGRQPARVITPLREPARSRDIPEPTANRETARPRDFGTAFIPEAVDDHYFDQATRQPRNRATIGTFARPSIGNIVEQTAMRIHRLRDDVDWLLFDEAPSLVDLRCVDVWVDPAVDDGDADGYVAEALVAGNAVIASRNAINTQRLEQGRIGILVPPRDPNELTHAILAALFKPEHRQDKISASQHAVSKFRVRHRARALIQLYESIL